MGLDEAKGLGGYQAMANAKFKALGIDSDAVYERAYDEAGRSIWKAKPLIDSTITKLKQLDEDNS